MPPLQRIYCCLKKIGKCRKRLEKKDKRTTLGNSSFRLLFNEFVEDQEGLFDDEDVICQKHHIDIRNSEGKFKGQQKRLSTGAPPSSPSAKLLRGRIVEVSTSLGNVHRRRRAVQMPPTTSGSSLFLSTSPAEQQSELPNNMMEFEYSEDSKMDFEMSMYEDVDALPTRMDETPRVPESPIPHHSRLPIVPIPSENSQVSLDSQLGVQFSQQSVVSFSESGTSSSSMLAFHHIQGTKNTQSKCFICNSTSGRKTIQWAAIQQVWNKLNFFLPKTNRVCPHHLDENLLFTADALDKIEASKQGINVKSFDLGLWLLEITNIGPRPPYSLDKNGIEASKYPLFFGVKKPDFDHLLANLEGHMRNTPSRSIKNGLAMFLLLLRNNLKQELIADMFGTSQQVVSQTIDTVSLTLTATFVPHNLGYYHITREEALKKHSRRLTSRVLGQPEDRLCVIADGTYNYIEKPSDIDLQRKTFSAHKKRNLLKPLYIVFPSGYILEAAGPYYCDRKNNDAANIHQHYHNSDLLLFLEKRDFFLFDRGYRDVVEETTSNGHTVFMPKLLDRKRNQFTCEEGNESRKVTMSRWVVEAVNGRIKNVFPWFKHTIEGSYVPKIMRFNRIACAIMNKFFPPIFPEDDEFHELVADVTLNETPNVNVFKEELERLKLIRMTVKFTKATAVSVPLFPRMTWEDLRRLTLGSFQLKVSNKYIEHHLKTDGDFSIMLYRNSTDLIRAEINSRHRKYHQHNIWIRFTPGAEGFSAILGHYCTCQVGERMLGVCSHITAVIRYLSFDRHQPPKENVRVLNPWDAIDCGEVQEEPEIEEEEEEEVILPIPV